MKIGDILREKQRNVYNKINSKPKEKERRHGGDNKDLTFSQIERLMKHDSYKRGPGGHIRQRTWSD